MCGADVHGEAIERVGFSGEQICARDIFDERKIARLLAIFVQHGRQIVQQSRAKNRNHTRIRIEDRLTRSVSTGVTQRDCGNADLLSPEKHKPLLVNFGQPINGFATDRRVLRRGDAFCDRATNRAVHLPIAAT